MDRCFPRPLRRAGIVLTLLCSGLLNGCGGGPPVKVPDASQQATISGKVTLDGTKPAGVDSSVVFYCPEKGATAGGKLDALGSYSVKAADASIGVPAGRYQVMVNPPSAPAVDMNSEEYKKKMMSGGGAPEAPKSDIPAKFNSYTTSNIVLEIKPGPNTIDLDLSKL
jgi:hypothetical protein